MLTLKKKGCKSIFCFLSRFLFKSIKNGQNRLYAIDQKQRKNRKYAQIHFLDRQINFLCCSGICYASGQFYRNCRVSKNRECSMAAVANKTFPILCFCLGITRTFHPPYTPFATIKNLRYCLVCL